MDTQNFGRINGSATTIETPSKTENNKPLNEIELQACTSTHIIELFCMWRDLLHTIADTHKNVPATTNQLSEWARISVKNWESHSQYHFCQFFAAFQFDFPHSELALFHVDTLCSTNTFHGISLFSYSVSYSESSFLPTHTVYVCVCSCMCDKERFFFIYNVQR